MECGQASGEQAGTAGGVHIIHPVVHFPGLHQQRLQDHGLSAEHLAMPRMRRYRVRTRPLWLGGLTPPHLSLLQVAMHESDAAASHQQVNLYQVPVVTVVEAGVGARQVVGLGYHKLYSCLQAVKLVSDGDA